MSTDMYLKWPVPDFDRPALGEHAVTTARAGSLELWLSLYALFIHNHQSHVSPRLLMWR